MDSVGGAAPSAAVLDTSARAEASRRNGARSRGPRTADGKVRSSQNALKHGLRAKSFVVLPDEDVAEYQAHEEVLVAELAPEGALQTLLARRIAAAAWRLMRADRIEAELFEHHCRGGGDLGLALVRDGHGARAFQTLLRYRGAAQAELWRSLRTFKALQAEAVAPAPEAGAGRVAAPVLEPSPARSARALQPAPERSADGAPGVSEPEPDANPFEPEGRRNPCRCAAPRGVEGALPVPSTPPPHRWPAGTAAIPGPPTRELAPALRLELSPGRGRPGSGAPRC